MYRASSIWAILIILAIGIGCFFGCRDDINVPFPASITGLWQGIYLYGEDSGGAASWDTTQLVTFRFTGVTEGTYQEAKDSSIHDTDRVFCGVLGEYVLQNNSIVMNQIDSNIPPSVCTFRQNPYGTFGINFPDATDDTLRMFHDSSAGGIRIQKLIRIVQVK